MSVPPPVFTFDDDEYESTPQNPGDAATGPSQDQSRFSVGNAGKYNISATDNRLGFDTKPFVDGSHKLKDAADSLQSAVDAMKGKFGKDVDSPEKAGGATLDDVVNAIKGLNQNQATPSASSPAYKTPTLGTKPSAASIPNPLQISAGRVAPGQNINFAAMVQGLFTNHLANPYAGQQISATARGAVFPQAANVASPTNQPTPINATAGQKVSAYANAASAGINLGRAHAQGNPVTATASAMYLGAANGAAAGRAAGPGGAAVGAAIGAAAAGVVSAFGSVKDAAKDYAASLDKYSAKIAISNSLAQNRQALGDIRRGNYLGDQVAGYTNVVSRLSQQGQDVTAAAVKIGLRVIVPWLEKLAAALEQLVQIGAVWASQLFEAVADVLDIIKKFDPTAYAEGMAVLTHDIADDIREMARMAKQSATDKAIGFDPLMAAFLNGGGVGLGNPNQVQQGHGWGVMPQGPINGARVIPNGNLLPPGDGF